MLTLWVFTQSNNNHECLSRFYNFINLLFMAISLVRAIIIKGNW